ncbi:MAG: hypothetical protein PHH54_05725 [Candidatus Nanoarchaeia archaeon]|nr:hypothetical protein [Candidatus Nanoarchaeia archaeon]MDD5741456.1 hypothetical protein [Candidatus Nanoarchaeia archaeon]
MIIKVLGILDLFVGLVFWTFGIFHIIPSNFVLILGLFLLVKGAVFVINLNSVSILDIISALIIILATSVVLPKLVVILIAIFLIQKGIFSMLS